MKNHATTADEILEMEAGRELDAIVAEHVLGWRWMSQPTQAGHTSERSMMVPPEGSDYEAFNFVPALGRQVDRHFARFSDWDMCCGRRDRSWPVSASVSSRQQIGLPHYSTDIAATWEIVEHLARQDRNLRMTVYAYARTYATFDDLDGEEEWMEANGDHHTPLAICRAALAAVLPE